MICLIAAIVAIISLILLSFYYSDSTTMGISICLGEFVLMVGLVIISRINNLIKTRLMFFFTNSIVFGIPVTLHFIFGDKTIWYIVTLLLVSTILFLRNYKVLSSSNPV